MLQKMAADLLGELKKRDKAFILVFASEESDKTKFQMFDAGNVTEQERAGILMHALQNPVKLDMPAETETEQ